MSPAQTGANHEDGRSLTWHLRWGKYMSIPPEPIKKIRGRSENSEFIQNSYQIYPSWNHFWYVQEIILTNTILIEDWAMTRHHPAFLTNDWKVSWSLITSSVATWCRRKHLFLYPHGDRSGLINPNKDENQH